MMRRKSVMNVLYVTNAASMYGANKSLLDMLEKLKNESINIYVVTIARGEIYKELKKRKISVYCIPYTTTARTENDRSFGKKYRRLINNLFYIKAIKKIVTEKRIDIIHSNASNIDIGAMAAIICKCPHVWHVRELLYEHYKLKYDFPLLSSFLFNRSKKIIAISEYVLKKRQFADNPRSCVLYDGLDVDIYSLKRENYFNKENLNILYCGVLSKEKGISDVVKAVRYLIDTGYKKIHLYIAGSENPYWKSVNDYISRSSLEQYITYCGYQKDLKELREKADVAVMCSRNEGLGRVTIESMLSELLVIGANSGATREIVKDGVTGYLYEAGNYKQLAEKIKLVLKEKEKSQRMIEEAKKFAIDHFNSDDYAEKIFELYKECLTERGL